MGALIRIACKCYSVLLTLYPRKLRDSYGTEMVDVLRQQLLDAFERNGAARVFRAGGTAVSELFTIAIPLTLTNEAFVTRTVSLATSSLIFLALLFALHNPQALDDLMRRLLGVHCL